jgi:hypothetical protein
MHRADAAISFKTVDPAEIRTEVVAHHREQPYLGDFFMGHHQLTGETTRVIIDGAAAGVAACHEDCLTYFRLDAAHRRLERQAVEAYVAVRGISHAYVASWDRHHVDLIGGFADTMRPQAYQFELLTESARGRRLLVAQSGVAAVDRTRRPDLRGHDLPDGARRPSLRVGVGPGRSGFERGQESLLRGLAEE